MLRNPFIATRGRHRPHTPTTMLAGGMIGSDELQLLVWRVGASAAWRIACWAALGIGLTVGLLAYAVPAAWPVFSVAIDAGHGGRDPGAVSADGLTEKSVALNVARMVASMLQAVGEQALLTRDSDQRLSNRQRSDLHARVRLAHRHAVDLLVSIHCNGHRQSSVRGPRTYYQPGSASGRRLAASVQQALRQAVGYGLREPTAEDHFVTRESSMTAIIVELGYLTNPDEARLLSDPERQRLLAQAVVNGILRYAADAGL